MMSTPPHDPFISDTCCHSICKRCMIDVVSNEEIFCPLCNARVGGYGINGTLKKIIKEKMERDKNRIKTAIINKFYSSFKITVSRTIYELSNSSSCNSK